jgi:predicted phosphodiesterase
MKFRNCKDRTHSFDWPVRAQSPGMSRCLESTLANYLRMAPCDTQQNAGSFIRVGGVRLTAPLLWMDMQFVAVISDIHANLPALEAVLEEIDGLGIEHILCCGDIVGYGPHPRECVEVLRQRKIPSVLGNHDLYVLQARNNKAVQEAEDELRGDTVWAGIIHAVAELRDEDFEWLLDLPSFIHMPGVIIGHAAMHDVNNWPYLVDDPDIIATLDELTTRKFSLGFFGHSHDQVWFTKSLKGSVKRSQKMKSILPKGAASAVVVGSVGQPRTGDPRAAWTLWKPHEKSIEFRRTAYPLHETMEAIKACGLPLRTAQRLAKGI